MKSLIGKEKRFLKKGMVLLGAWPKLRLGSGGFRSIEISTFLLLAEFGIEERYRSATFWYWYMNKFWPLFLLFISNFILGY